MSDIIFEIKRLQKLANLSEQKKEVVYTAIVLTKNSHNLLKDLFSHAFPVDWKFISHHVTVNLKSFTGDRRLLNTNQVIIANSFVKDEKICAVGVIMPPNIVSKNKNPHITIAFDEKNARAKDSNNLDWNNAKLIENIILEGKLVEIISGKEILFAEDYPVIEH